VKQAQEASARLVDAPPEIEPVAARYFPRGLAEERGRRSATWLWLLWERRRFVGRFCLAGLLVSAIVALLIPARYESTTRLMPPDTQSGSGMAMLAALSSKGGAGLSSLAGDLLGVKSSGALFVDVLSGRTVRDGLVRRFDLRKVYGDRYWEDARKDLAQRTSVAEDRKSGVITITVTDRDRNRAAQMAQAYVEELDRLVAEVSTSSARRQRIFIEQRLQTVSRDLEAASQQFSQYASQNTTIDITAQGKSMVEAAAKLEGEEIAAQSELEGLEQVYTKNNVRVRSLQARVDELQAQLHKLGGSSSDPTAGTPGAQEFPSIRQLPLLGVKWADLYRQTKIQETVFELLTQQYELAKIEEAKEIPVVKVLDAADVPEKRSGPPRLLIVVLGTLLGLCAAVSCVVGLALWQQADPGDPRKELGEEIFGNLKGQLQLGWQRATKPGKHAPE
jgi:capsule polysaccharide export protein KpsE/RkpR